MTTSNHASTNPNETARPNDVIGEWERILDEAEVFQEVTDDPLGPLGSWLTPQYAVAARRRLAEVEEDGKERFEVMRAYVRDWSRLRTRGQAQAHVELAQRKAKRLEPKVADPQQTQAQLEDIGKRVLAAQRAIWEREREREQANKAKS